MIKSMPLNKLVPSKKNVRKRSGPAADAWPAVGLPHAPPRCAHGPYHLGHPHLLLGHGRLQTGQLDLLGPLQQQQQYPRYKNGANSSSGIKYRRGDL